MNEMTKKTLYISEVDVQGGPMNEWRAPLCVKDGPKA